MIIANLACLKRGGESIIGSTFRNILKKKNVIGPDVESLRNPSEKAFYSILPLLPVVLDEVEDLR